MNGEYKKALDFLNDTKINNFVSNNKCFSDLAIEYLVNETKLSKEECSTAYDIIMKIED